MNAGNARVPLHFPLDPLRHPRQLYKPSTRLPHDLADTRAGFLELDLQTLHCHLYQ
jgi:hypothetical protein